MVPGFRRPLGLMAAAFLALAPGCSRPPVKSAAGGEQSPDPVASLIGELHADDIERREAAAAKLVALGLRARESVAAAMPIADDAEVRARLAAVLDEIDRRERIAPDGGRAVGGLQAILRIQRRTFRAGDPIECELAIRNVAGQPARLVTPATVRCEAPWGIYFEGAAHITIRVTRAGTGPPPWPFAGHQDCTGPRREQLALAAGEEVACRRDIEELRRLLHGMYRDLRERADRIIRWSPGEYEISFVYGSATEKFVDGAEEDLVSNVVRVRIE